MKKSRLNRKKLPVRHIGNVIALCNKNLATMPHSLRTDLGYDRYKQLGVVERFKDQAPYRVCDKCLEKVFAKENFYNKRYKHKSWNYYYNHKE